MSSKTAVAQKYEYNQALYPKISLCVRIVELLLCLACLAMAIYFATVIICAIGAAIILIAIAIAFFIVTAIDLYARLHSRQYSSATWMSAAFIAALCFFLGAGVMFFRTVLLFILTAVLFLITGIVFLLETCCIGRKLSKIHVLVCPEIYCPGKCVVTEGTKTESKPSIIQDDHKHEIPSSIPSTKVVCDLSTCWPPCKRARSIQTNSPMISNAPTYMSSNEKSSPPLSKSAYCPYYGNVQPPCHKGRENKTAPNFAIQTQSESPSSSKTIVCQCPEKPLKESLHSPIQLTDSVSPRHLPIPRKSCTRIPCGRQECQSQKRQQIPETTTPNKPRRPQYPLSPCPHKRNATETPHAKYLGVECAAERTRSIGNQMSHIPIKRNNECNKETPFTNLNTNLNSGRHRCAAECGKKSPDHFKDISRNTYPVISKVISKPLEIKKSNITENKSDYASSPTLVIKLGCPGCTLKMPQQKPSNIQHCETRNQNMPKYGKTPHDEKMSTYFMVTNDQKPFTVFPRKFLKYEKPLIDVASQCTKLFNRNTQQTNKKFTYAKHQDVLVKKVSSESILKYMSPNLGTLKDLFEDKIENTSSKTSQESEANKTEKPHWTSLTSLDYNSEIWENRETTDKQANEFHKVSKTHTSPTSTSTQTMKLKVPYHSLMEEATHFPAPLEIKSLADLPYHPKNEDMVEDSIAQNQCFKSRKKSLLTYLTGFQPHPDQVLDQVREENETDKSDNKRKKARSPNTIAKKDY